MIASGAAAGLAAAFNAPIAGLLFVVEEVYHHFSRFFWVSTLAASLVANFVSLLIFGLTPVLDMPDNIPLMTLDQYWIYLLMGIFLGLSGFLYEKAVLNVGRVYDWIGQKIRLDRAYYPIFAFILIIPVGIFLPQILGGGNQLVLSLTEQNFSFQVLLAYFLIRFVWSMISYGSGLPGGIFLPIFGAWFLTWCPSWCHLCEYWTCQSGTISYICHSGNEWILWSNIQGSLNCYDTRN